MAALEHAKPLPEVVLAKAVLRAAEQLGLKQAELAAVLGVHRTAISRLQKNPSLDPNSKEGELALFLIRLARALYALTGGDKDWIQHFMRTRNKVTGGVPAKQIEKIEGLMAVLRFVDNERHDQKQHPLDAKNGLTGNTIALPRGEGRIGSCDCPAWRS